MEENQMLEKNFKKVFKDIKNEILNAQYDIYKSANIRTLALYSYLGQVIDENAKYGNGFINNLSIELKVNFPNMKGFSERNLLNMKKYYLECKNNGNLKKLSEKIPWSHNILIFSKIKNEEQREWYIEQTSINGWSYDDLAFQIKSDLYKRQVLGDKPNNFQNTLQAPQSRLAKDMMKDPYILNLSNLKESFIETELEKAMVERIKTVLLELGNGFSFVGNQYKISTNDNDYYIDLLFYHLDLRCFVLVELKNTEFRPEYVGQLGFYVTAVDDTLKKETDNETIGLLLFEDNEEIEEENLYKPCSKNIYSRVKNMDWILHEAMCLEKDKEKVKPHEKNYLLKKLKNIFRELFMFQMI